jgi:hypothetical protein
LRRDKDTRNKGFFARPHSLQAWSPGAGALTPLRILACIGSGCGSGFNSRAVARTINA